MDPEVRTLVDISETPAALESQADIVLERARWAAEIFQRYDRDMTMNAYLFDLWPPVAPG